jgi:PAS domain S-box-containing protein
MDEIVNVENVRTQLANIMATDFREVSIAIQTIIVDKNKTSVEEQKKQISNSRKSYDESFIKYEALVTKDETKILDQILKVKGFAEETRAENNIVIALVAEGKYDAAIGEFIKNEKPKMRALIENINVLVILENKNTLGHYQNAQNVYANVRFMMFLFGGITLVIAATIALLLTRSITKPLKLATNLVLTRDISLDISEYEKGSGELGLMIQSFRKDISERMRLEEEMKKAAGYARNLIEASLDPLVTISAEGKITDVNAATIKVTGVSREQLIGSDFANYFTEPEKARTGYKQVFSQGVVIDYPLTMRNSSGQTMEVLYNASVYKNETGEVLGVFAAARDITASKLQEKELIEYRDQLEETVKQRTADLTKIIIEVRETVNVLASASSEILAATTQVATGTAETSTAIHETSTTVEEVQQASKQSSQKAQNVADSAQKVVQVFQNGKKAVEETTAGISNIKEQMDSIAQTVVRLSEQSQSIGGIIASVTDIADQSNLLAVNAAIEAAKAGEQGKGFAVVAQEIKNLASQSKQATLKVRNILNDVQKATGAAVMATEQGSKAVDSGLKQSLLAGEAIRILAESSNEAVQASTQIVASSQQQVVGMDQIGIAMQNISQAGTETAVSMAQAERSARSLYELGQKLKDLIGDFKE